MVGYFIISLPTMATESTISIGNLNEYIRKIQTNENGDLNTFSFTPYLDYKLNFSLDEYLKNTFFNLELGTTLPKSDKDPNTSRIKFFSLANFLYRPNSHFVGLGAGLFFTRISGNGGEETLNNGSTTSSFPLPDKAVISRNMIVNFFYGYQFKSNINLEMQVLGFNITTKEERAFSIGTSIAYRLGELF
jgi:hypothetical protein